MKTLIGLLLTTSIASALTLEWDMNTEKHLGGYRVYIGEESSKPTASMDVGKVRPYTFESAFAPGKPFYFVVRAYNTDGEEGEPTNEVKYLEDEQPLKPLKISDIEGLQEALDAKSDKSHTHEIPSSRTQPSQEHGR